MPRRKKTMLDHLEIPDPQVKARVMAVLQALSGEKGITEICQETGLKQVQYYALETQMLKAMVMAAQASVQGRKGNLWQESHTLEDRNRKLRQDNRRMQALLRLTKKLFKMGPRVRKPRKWEKKLPMGATKPDPMTGSPPAATR